MSQHWCHRVKGVWRDYWNMSRYIISYQCKQHLLWRQKICKLPEQSDWCDNMPVHSYDYAPNRPFPLTSKYVQNHIYVLQSIASYGKAHIFWLFPCIPQRLRFLSVHWVHHSIPGSVNWLMRTTTPGKDSQEEGRGLRLTLKSFAVTSLHPCCLLRICYIILYCLYAGVAPTMITNQCYFSQVQAGEAKTSHGGNQRPFALPGEEREGRSEWVGSLKLMSSWR